MELVSIESNSMFFEPTRFYSAIALAEKTERESNIKAIIVPHHLLASNIIADLFKRASGREISNVIIIGPNHENIGSHHIATAKAKWKTPLGDVETNNRLIEQICADLKTESTPSVFTNEHSIGAMAPFVKQYFPHAKIAPIILDSYADKAEMEKVSTWLEANTDEQTLVVYSMDFSHYLPVEEANKRDKVTEKLILEKNVSELLKLSNTENVDSPVSLAIALQAAINQNYVTNILHNNNSFNLLNIKPVETTSYFGISFTK